MPPFKLLGFLPVPAVTSDPRISCTSSLREGLPAQSRVPALVLGKGTTAAVVADAADDDGATRVLREAPELSPSSCSLKDSMVSARRSLYRCRGKRNRE